MRTTLEAKWSIVTIRVKTKVFKHMEKKQWKISEQIPSVHQNNCSSWIMWIMWAYLKRQTMRDNCYFFHLPRGWRDNFTFLYQEKDSLLSSSLSWRGNIWIRIPLDCSLRTKMYIRKQRVTYSVVIFRHTLLFCCQVLWRMKMLWTQEVTGWSFIC